MELQSKKCEISPTLKYYLGGPHLGLISNDGLLILWGDPCQTTKLPGTTVFTQTTTSMLGLGSQNWYWKHSQKKTSRANICLLPGPNEFCIYNFFQLERHAAVGLLPSFTLNEIPNNKAILPRSQYKLTLSWFWPPVSGPTAQSGLQALSNRASATTKPICTAAPTACFFPSLGNKMIRGGQQGYRLIRLCIASGMAALRMKTHKAESMYNVHFETDNILAWWLVQCKCWEVSHNDAENNFTLMTPRKKRKMRYSI